MSECYCFLAYSMYVLAYSMYSMYVCNNKTKLAWAEVKLRVREPRSPTYPKIHMSV